MAVKKKISDITRDFDFKSVKDTLVALKDMGMEKTTGGVLDDNEYAVFLQVYTAANQIANLDAYLDGVATLSYVEEKPQKKEKKADAPKGYVCKICGWIYEGEHLPEDIVCPLCKHGAADFEPLS